MRDGLESGNELIAQSAYIRRVFLEIRARLGECRRHGNNAADIFRTGTFAALLRATLDHVHQRDAPAGIQCADSLRAVELVRGNGEHVDVLRFYVDGDMARRLHRVRVEDNALFAADRADLRDGLDGTDLVIGVHDRHKAGVLADGAAHLLGRDDAVFVDVQQRDLVAVFLKLLERMQYRVMLKRRGNDVFFALLRADGRRGENGLVVRLAAAGGEGDLPRLGTQTPGYRFARRGERFRRLLAECIKARGVAVPGVQIRQHRVDGRFAHLRGRRVVRIYKHGKSSFQKSYCFCMFTM